MLHSHFRKLNTCDVIIIINNYYYSVVFSVLRLCAIVQWSTIIGKEEPRTKWLKQAGAGEKMQRKKNPDERGIAFNEILIIFRWKFDRETLMASKTMRWYSEILLIISGFGVRFLVNLACRQCKYANENGWCATMGPFFIVL